MKIEWSEPAVIDLENIKEYIDNDSVFYANIFVEKILDAVEKLSELPIMGRFVPEADDTEIREIIYRNYRIIYKVEINKILVLAVVHGARDLERHNKPWEVE